VRFWRRRSIIRTVLATFVGILALVVLVAILQTMSTGNPVIQQLLLLLDLSLPLLIVIALLLMTGTIFDRFDFPLNLPSPLFYALASVFLVIFIFDVFRFLNDITGANIYQNLEILRILLSILIFLIVFTGCYFRIFGDLLRTGRERELKGEARPVSPDVKTWNNIGNEFRQLIFDILRRMREEIWEREE